MSARRFRWSAKLAELDRVAFARAGAQRASGCWPALGAQRRLEARIGQLLGDAKHGGDRRSDQSHHDDLGPVRHTQDRSDFRVLEVDLTAEAAL